MSTVVLLFVSLVIVVNGLREESSGNNDPEDIQNRLINLEQAVTKLQSENAALRTEVNNTKFNLQESSYAESNFSMLEDSIKELQSINVDNQEKIAVLQHQLLESKYELADLKLYSKMLHAKIAPMIHKLYQLQNQLQASSNASADLKTFVITLNYTMGTLQNALISARHNVTSLQQSIELIVENVTILMNKSSLDDVKLAELTGAGSTLQSLFVTMESRLSQFQSVISNNHSWTQGRLNELDNKLGTRISQLIKKKRKQDKQLMKMNKQVTDLKQIVDTISAGDAYVQQ